MVFIIKKDTIVPFIFLPVLKKRYIYIEVLQQINKGKYEKQAKIIHDICTEAALCKFLNKKIPL